MPSSHAIGTTRLISSESTSNRCWRSPADCSGSNHSTVGGSAPRWRRSSPTSTPPRFLPEYDNLLLSHADRSRFVTEVDRRRLSDGTRAVHGSVLIDGMLGATWRVEASDLVVDHLHPLAKRTADRVAAEGRRLMRLLVPDRTGDVRLELLPS